VHKQGLLFYFDEMKAITFSKKLMRHLGISSRSTKYLLSFQIHIFEYLHNPGV